MGYNRDEKTPTQSRVGIVQIEVASISPEAASVLQFRGSSLEDHISPRKIAGAHPVKTAYLETLSCDM